jgi:hypothetical protein
MKRILIPVALVLVCRAAFGMAGGPLFCVSQQMTSMTVEAVKTNLDIQAPSSGDDRESAASERLLLTARYGLAPCLDIAASVGTANLRFSDLPSGYGDFSAGWSLAWGASLRAGAPLHGGRYQVVAAVNYFGFQPKGDIGNGTKSVSTKYLWHELSPALAMGVRFGPVVPYVGATKPFLFGRRDVAVTLNGQEFPAAGGVSNYSDSEQPLRGLLGIEWRLPEGYSLTAEAAATTGGVWTMSVGLAQVLR